MSRVQGMRAIARDGADGPQGAVGMPDEQDVSFALMACIFGAVVRQGIRRAALASRPLQRVARAEVSSRLESA